MKLSDALMLAATAYAPVRESEWDSCALSVAALVAGVPGEIAVPLMGETIYLHERPQSIINYWPWLGSAEDDDSFLWQISDFFEDYGWSMTRLAEWTAKVEPTCGECNRFVCTCVKTEPQPAANEMITA